MLYASHMLLAAAITPHIALDDTEARQLAEAIANVSQHYTMLGGNMSPEQAAWANLLMVAGMIYGPKGFAAYQDRKMGEPGGHA